MKFGVINRLAYAINCTDFFLISFRGYWQNGNAVWLGVCELSQ